MPVLRPRASDPDHIEVVTSVQRRRRWWRRLMTEGGKEAVRADDQFVAPAALATLLTYYFGDETFEQQIFELLEALLDGRRIAEKGAS
jgi:hypothetical protein